MSIGEVFRAAYRSNSIKGLYLGFLSAFAVRYTLPGGLSNSTVKKVTELAIATLFFAHFSGVGIRRRMRNLGINDLNVPQERPITCERIACSVGTGIVVSGMILGFGLYAEDQLITQDLVLRENYWTPISEYVFAACCIGQLILGAFNDDFDNLRI